MGKCNADTKKGSQVDPGGPGGNKSGETEESASLKPLIDGFINHLNHTGRLKVRLVETAANRV